MAQPMIPWDTNYEPNEHNIVQWMDSTYEKYESIEQARWNQSNIDTLFYAGEQNFINSYFNFTPNNNYQNFHFNFLQQPINMVTGYQRQHRKSISYVPVEGTQQEFSDDLSTVVKYANSYRNVLEKFSKGCEQACISGMTMIQPFLDYSDDPINGTLDLKVYSYNSYMTDPYFRDTEQMTDCNFVWTQDYISKPLAKQYFPEKADLINSMSPYNGNTRGKFYFLPENYNIARNELLVMSHVWFKSKRMRQFLYNRQDGIMYEIAQHVEDPMEIVNQTNGMFDLIEYEVPTYKLAVVLNNIPMYIGLNPMGFDEFPMVPLIWNYDPHVSQYDLRVRSLTRSMRDSQFLLNRRVIINHDISESSINSGFIRKENSIANEEDLQYTGQGKDIIIKEGYEITDIIKIVPNAVPASDMELANQLSDFIFKTSGVNQELMGMADDTDIGITTMLRQGAGLVTLQKYFDQWDTSLKYLGRLEQKIIQNNWSPSKIKRILGKEPNIQFQTGLFSKYSVLAEEGINTTIQQQQEFVQAVKLNEMLGGIIPPKYLLEKSNLQGKDDIIKAIEEAQQQQAEMAKEAQMIEQAKMEAEIQEISSRSVANIGLARERHGRNEANIGLFEERLSQITQNRASALKDKVDAIEKLLTIYRENGILNTEIAENELQQMSDTLIAEEDFEKAEAKQTSDSNKFVAELMQNNQKNPMMENDQQIPTLGINQQTKASLL